MSTPGNQKKKKTELAAAARLDVISDVVAARTLRPVFITAVKPEIYISLYLEDPLALHRFTAL